MINQYAGSKYHGMNYRSFYIGRELVHLGYHVRLFAGSFSHLLRSLPTFEDRFKEENIDGIDYVWVRTLKYTGSKSFRRTIGMFQFIWNLLFLKLKSFEKPDAIVVSSISPLPILNAYFWSRKYKAKLIFEVRDIWPLSLIELGNVSRFHPFVIFLQWIENFAYRKSNKVISVLPNALEHMKQHGLDASKFEYIPNGIDCNENIQANTEQLPDYRKNSSFVVGYLGTLGIANALDYFIDAAISLKEEKNISFVLVGKGPEEERMKARIEKTKANIKLFPSVKKNQVQAVLSQFDVCYVGWFDHPLYRFGISPNKIFDYMLSGKPIIHSSNASNDPIKEANCGISIPAEDKDAIVHAILEMKSKSKNEIEIMSKNGIAYVKNKHDYSQLAMKYSTLF
ncbi:MAG: glycosyltransferase family 4 protein [Bacteroidales bacterium]|nr:glycosyltransferase family 4 protein [Bacteroidales bacterium]